jgi:hypothetical protein
MERHFKSMFGKQFRKEFVVPDDLPFPMRKALEALANNEVELPQTRGGCGQDPTSTNVTLAWKSD